jgi:hypothetical protein
MLRKPKIIRATLAASLLVSHSVTANPSPLTVQDLLGLCQRNNTMCVGYIAGVSDALTMVSSIPNHNALVSVCPEAGVTYGAARQAFINWATRHPEHWPEGLLVGVTLALQETWQCEQ